MFILQTIIALLVLMSPGEMVTPPLTLRERGTVIHLLLLDPPGTKVQGPAPAGLPRSEPPREEGAALHQAGALQAEGGREGRGEDGPLGQNGGWPAKTNAARLDDGSGEECSWWTGQSVTLAN